MKKLLSFLFIFLLVIMSFCSCGSKYEVSDSAQKAGEKALQIIDNFLDFKVEINEATDDLITIEDRIPDELKDDDNVKTMITLSKFTISDFKSDADSTKLTRELILNRNDLADYIGKEKRQIPFNGKAKKVNLKDLCKKASKYEYSFVTTTIKTNKEARPNDWYYDFQIEGTDYCDITFNTNGYNVNNPDSELITITGILKYMSYNITNEKPSFSIEIIAVNNNAVDTNYDKNLFYNLSKLSINDLDIS